MLVRSRVTCDDGWLMGGDVGVTEPVMRDDTTRLAFPLIQCRQKKCREVERETNMVNLKQCNWVRERETGGLKLLYVLCKVTCDLLQG